MMRIAYPDHRAWQLALNVRMMRRTIQIEDGRWPGPG